MPPQGFDPLPVHPKGPPLYYFEISIFWAVFSIFFMRRRKLGQNRDFLVLCESLKNQFAQSKKKVRHPRDNPRSTPVHY